MTKKTFAAILGLAALAGCRISSVETSAALALSPDGRNAIRLWTDPIAYSVERDGVTLVAKTPIGLKQDGKCLCADAKVRNVSSTTVGGRLAMPVYKKSSIDLAGSETYVDFGDWGIRLAARNDGVAYRFETKRPGEVTVDGEKFGVTIASKDADALVYRTGSSGCEEQVPVNMKAGEIETVAGPGNRAMVYLPLVYSMEGKTVAVVESDVCDYPIVNLKRGEAQDGVLLSADFSKWPTNTERVKRNIIVRSCADYLVKTEGTRAFPWRGFLLADSPIALVEADLVTALARPAAKGRDFSWVKPGKVAWDWWNAFDNIGDPEGCTTKTYERFIDFAAKNGVEYVIFDEGWSEKLNIWKFHPNVDVPHLIKYGRDRGVGIILWMAWSQVAGDEARVAEHFAKLGAVGFKVDFMDRGDAEVERFLWKFAEECARNRMLVDYHGAHRPTGMSRAYPNVLNYEGIHGLEQMKFYHGQDILMNDVAAVFGRLSAGPMDYTPGAMDNYVLGTYPTKRRGYDKKHSTATNPGSLGTRARQMAMMAIFEAPLQMLCDSPTKYEKNMESFTFMSKVPVVWAKTVGIGGTPATYAAVARQAKDGAWYASAITDSRAREIEVDTSFLGQGKWRAEVFRDAEDAAKNPRHYVHETLTVEAGRVLRLSLAPGGGFVIRFVRTDSSRPQALTTEYRVNPTGLDSSRPRLSWRLAEGLREQTAYEIEADGVACGKTAGDSHVCVEWPGRELGSGERHVWRVRVWDEDGVAGAWSDRAEFTTGIMKPADWKAKWIATNAAARPDEEFGAAEWITAPANKQGVTELAATLDFDGAAEGTVVDFVSAGVPHQVVTVNGRNFHLPSGHVYDWRHPAYRDMTPYLRRGKNEIAVRVKTDDAMRPGEPIDHRRFPTPKGVRAFIAKIRMPNGRTIVTNAKDWRSPDGEVKSLGRVREPAFARDLILRTETASPAFAKRFRVRGPVASAVLHVTGVGFYEASLNGRKIGDKVLDPAPTAYDHRVLYSTYRLDDELRVGENELKLLVGHGWYDVRVNGTWNFNYAPWRDFPRAIAQLDIVYRDGTRETVSTDGTWREVKSPVGYDDIREGEVIGAHDPASPDFDAREIFAAEVAGPKGRLVSESQPGAKIVEEIAPSAVRDLGRGEWLVSFPAELAGWVRLTLRGQKKGDVVTVRYDERINANGTPARNSQTDGLHDCKFYNHNSQKEGKTGEIRWIDVHYRYAASHRVCAKDAAFQTDRYVASGIDGETYEPRFTYNGFRHVYLKGLAARPGIVACFVQTDFARNSSFVCSDKTFNQLMRMADRSYRCNFTDGVPTDCPHREKNGWTGDAGTASELAQFCYENTSAYEKWLRDIVDAQLPNGNLPGIVPTSGWGFHWGNGPAWDMALPVVAWNLYLYRGDRRILDETYDAIVKIADFTTSLSDGDGLVNHGLGDWISVNRKKMPTREYTSSCYYLQELRIAEEIARLKGLDKDAARFAAASARTVAGMRKKYYRGNGVWDDGRQTAQAIAITYGLTDGATRGPTAEKLVAAVEKADGHVDLGLIGTKHVFRALSEIGRTDLAFRMLTNPTWPSPVYWIQHGGETIWEDWKTGVSRTHIMFGDFAAWAYQYLGGIRLAGDGRSTCAVPTGVSAFSKILLAPQPIDALNFVESNVETPHGFVRSAWYREGKAVRYRFTVPAGITAEIRLPGESPRRVTAGVYEFSSNVR